MWKVWKILLHSHTTYTIYHLYYNPHRLAIHTTKPIISHKCHWTTVQNRPPSLKMRQGSQELALTSFMIGWNINYEHGSECSVSSHNKAEQRGFSLTPSHVTSNYEHGSECSVSSYNKAEQRGFFLTPSRISSITNMDLNVSLFLIVRQNKDGFP